MRFSTQEVSGSRVRLRYSVELHYAVDGPSEFLLNVHAARNRRQAVVEEPSAPTLHGTVAERGRVYRKSHRCVCRRIGLLVVRYAALVEISHRIVEPADIAAAPPSALDAGTLRYLYPSWFCQADLIQQNAWDRFGALPRGYGQVLAVRDWVRQSLKFQIGISRSTTSAVDTLRDGAGSAATLRTR